jgi:endonuclease/exonuclease/phosphatase family metal-dependent hydrolase
MKSKISFLIFLVCVSLHAEIITVAAYNVDNFCLEDRMIDGVFRQKYPKPEAEKAALVAVIKAANADVLAIEEMGTQEFLDELLGRLKAAGVDYPYHTLMLGGDPYRHLAILSKKKFETRHFGDLTFNYEGRRAEVLRGLMEVSFTTPEGKTWQMFSVHLKSRISKDVMDEESEGYRIGEATAIREQILEIENNIGVSPQTPGNFIVVGDFNDEPRSAALKRFLVKGKRTLTIMTNPVDSRGEEWTHHWALHGSFSRIDYILTSPAMAPAIVPGSPKIIDIPESTIGSDHRPVVAQIDTEKIGGGR